MSRLLLYHSSPNTNKTMSPEKIIAYGDTAKYQVVITHADYDQQTDPFHVVIHCGIPDAALVIDRADMLHDEDGNFYMLVPTNGMAGPMKAECHYSVTDSDPEGGVRDEVDYQWLAFVTDEPCPRFACRCDCEPDPDAHVQYTRIWRNDARSLYLNVRTVDKEPVRDVDGQQIRVRKEDKDIY